jgi:hypothetical protein
MGDVYRSKLDLFFSLIETNLNATCERVLLAHPSRKTSPDDLTVMLRGTYLQSSIPDPIF